MTLRPFQARAVDAVRAVLPFAPVLVSPTGSGKTVMGVSLIERLKMHALWLAHRDELIDQAAKGLRDLGVFVGLVQPGQPLDPLAPVQVASVATAVRRDLPVPQILFVDEAHHATASQYRQLIARWPQAFRVGLTATPFRLDGTGMEDLFHRIVVAAYPDELISLGLLVAPRIYSIRLPNLEGLRVVGGDFNLTDVVKRVDMAEFRADIIQEWKRRADGRPTVCYACDVDHSRRIVDAFKNAGVAAEHLDGQSSREERRAILGRLRSGNTQVVSNCMILTEGWDMRSLGCVIMARPTASLCLFLQMVGRVMRPDEGKPDALILDFAGNTHRHGMPTRRIEYSLDGVVRRGAGDPLGLVRCQQCGLYYESGGVCPECGTMNAPPADRQPVQITGEGGLEEHVEDFAYRARVWRSIEDERISMGFADGWAIHAYRERFGVYPCLGIDNELVDPRTATLDQKESVYLRLLGVAAQRGFSDGWASHQYKREFGVWPRGFVSRARIEDRYGRKVRNG